MSGVQNSGATTPSEKFWPGCSMAARATPASSNASGLRPTIIATARRLPPRCRLFPARRRRRRHAHRGFSAREASRRGARAAERAAASPGKARRQGPSPPPSTTSQKTRLSAPFRREIAGGSLKRFDSPSRSPPTSAIDHVANCHVRHDDDNWSPPSGPAPARSAGPRTVPKRVSFIQQQHS